MSAEHRQLTTARQQPTTTPPTTVYTCTCTCICLCNRNTALSNDAYILDSVKGGVMHVDDLLAAWPNMSGRSRDADGSSQAYRTKRIGCMHTSLLLDLDYGTSLRYYRRLSLSGPAESGPLWTGLVTRQARGTHGSYNSRHDRIFSAAADWEHLHLHGASSDTRRIWKKRPIIHHNHYRRHDRYSSPQDTRGTV